MEVWQIILIVTGVIVTVSIMLYIINILQKGGKYKGQSIEEIVGKKPGDVTEEDLRKLSKSDCFQLFYAAKAPEFSKFKGEYKADTLNVGVMAPFANYYTHHFFGPGYWIGKAFNPFETDKGWGYNIFKETKNGKEIIHRTRKMDTHIGPSLIDDQDSFHLIYKPYNGGTVKSMHDELRIINDNLYIGMGYMGIGGGSINPAPFIIVGPPTEWVGIDKK